MAGRAAKAAVGSAAERDRHGDESDTAGQEVKIIKDLGLSAISLFGHFIAIFIGIGLVSKEVERRSIYALLAKPMSRTELLLGKFFGLVATLAVNVAVMSTPG